MIVQKIVIEEGRPSFPFLSLLPCVKNKKKKCSKTKVLHWTQIKVIFDIFPKLCFIFLSFEIDFTESPWGILLKCYIAFILSELKEMENTWVQLKIFYMKKITWLWFNSRTYSIFLRYYFIRFYRIFKISIHFQKDNLD